MPYSREYYERTKEKQRAYQQQYRAKRTAEERERVSEMQKAWRIAHPEALDRYDEKRRKKNK